MSWNKSSNYNSMHGATIKIIITVVYSLYEMLMFFVN